jgi:hypothetical protein
MLARVMCNVTTLFLYFAESLQLGRPVRGLLLEVSRDRDRHLHLTHPEQIPPRQGCRKTNAAGEFFCDMRRDYFDFILCIISFRTITTMKNEMF